MKVIQYIRHRLDPTVGYARFETLRSSPVVDLAHSITLVAILANSKKAGIR